MISCSSGSSSIPLDDGSDQGLEGLTSRQVVEEAFLFSSMQFQVEF